MFDFIGLLILLVSLVFVVAIQVGATLGSMWILNRAAGDKLQATTYLEFDFENFNKQHLIELLLRLTIAFAPATFLLHLFIFFFCDFSIRQHVNIWGFVLMLLEGAAAAAGFIYLIKLDHIRALILAASAAIVYAFIYGIFLHKVLY